MKITIIGAGNMGGALAKGLIRAVKQSKQNGGSENNILTQESDLCITAKSQATIDKFKEAYPEIRTSLNNAEAVRDADIIVLAVKPWLIKSVIVEMRNNINPEQQIVCSLAAGIYTEELREFFLEGASTVSTLNLRLSTLNLFYCMPNIAAEFGKSMTFVTASNNAQQPAVEAVANLFKMVGDVNVCEERMMDPGLMMAGCGIAYVMRFLRALMEAGVEMGFYPKEAQRIAMQTMEGAVKLLRETGLHPEAAIDLVTTPGGISIKGLNELDHAGFNSAVVRCIKAGLKQ